MRRRLEDERVRWLLLVAAAVLVLAAIDVWWVAEYRHGFPFDVDEAGYTTIALNDYLGFENGGVSGWWETFQNQTPNAPLLPALTSLVMIIVEPGILQGFGVLIGFFAILAFATYGIGTRLAGPRLGALAALVVAVSPGMFIFTRELIFALPTAAMLACAVYALIRSEGLQLSRWAIACGAAIGFMLLARTMAVAFLPGLGIAAVVVVIARHRQRDALLRGLLNLCLLAAAAVAVAATWYVKNFQPVYDYLTGFGYGSKSGEFGDEYSALSWDKWTAVAKRMVETDLLVPLAAMIFIAFVALGVVLVRRVAASSDRRTTLIKLSSSDAATVLIVAALGYLVLSSSQNAGNGFTFPLAMLLPPLAVVALREYRRALIPAVAVLAAIGVTNTIAYSSLWEDTYRRQIVHVPTLGALPWLDGTPNAIDAIRQQVPGPHARFAESERGWMEADEIVAAEVLAMPGPPLTAFASRNRVISTNSVQLAALAKFHRSIPFTQLYAEPTDSVETYVRQLSDPAGGLPPVVITTSTNAGDFEPLVTQPYVEQAARQIGYSKTREVPLPDGRQLRIWVRPPA